MENEPSAGHRRERRENLNRRKYCQQALGTSQSFTSQVDTFAELVRFLFCRKVRSKSLENCLGFAIASLAEGMRAGTTHQSCFCFCKADSKCSQWYSFFECHEHMLSFCISQIFPLMEVSTSQNTLGSPFNFSANMGQETWKMPHRWNLGECPIDTMSWHLIDIFRQLVWTLQLPTPQWTLSPGYNVKLQRDFF